MKHFSFGLCAAFLLFFTACQKQPLESVNGASSPIQQGADRGVVIPDMDVVVGYTAQQQNCSGSAQLVSTSTNNGVTTFSWSPNDQFIITISAGGTAETIRLLTEGGSGGNAGTAKYFKQANYSCLSNPGTSESTDHKELTLSVASNNLAIRGYDNNDGTTTRHIAIAHPAGYSIVVAKY